MATTDWPPRWSGSHFKQPRAGKIGRGLKRQKQVSSEQSKMLEVRRRDRYCRFPLCGCKKFNLVLQVSHSKHRGMGGNPKGDRTEPELMVLVCVARHKANVISIDRGTLRWRALTKAGGDGPIAWEIDGKGLTTDSSKRWIEVARETAIHSYEPFTPAQQVMLERLREMEV